MKGNLQEDKFRNVNQLFVNGDRRLMQALQEKYLNMVYSLVKKMGGDNEGINAKDVYTDAIIVVWQNVCSGKLTLSASNNGEIRVQGLKSVFKTSAKFSTYLYKTAKNIWQKSPFNQHNDNKLRFSAEDVLSIDYQFSTHAKDEANFEEDMFVQRFRQLSPVCKWIIVMHKLCKLKFSELASIRKISVGYSRNLFSRCWQKLINPKFSRPVKSKVENLSGNTDSILAVIESAVNEPLKLHGNNLLISIISEKLYYQELPFLLSEKCKCIIDNDQILRNKFDLFNEINSFLDEFQYDGFRLNDKSKALNNKEYFKFRNTFFGQKFDLLPTESRITMVLHHNSCEDLTSLSTLLGLNMDETFTCIHNHKIKFAELIILDTVNYTQWLKRRGMEYGKQV